MVVFRSQIAWGMYMEGRAHLGVIISRSRFLSLEILASLAHTAVEGDLDVSIAQSAHQQDQHQHFHRQEGEEDEQQEDGGDGGGDDVAPRALPAAMQIKRSTSMRKEELGRSCSLGASSTDVETELAVLALESIRLIKLFYWVVVEHLRSTDGHTTWGYANEMVDRFATQVGR